MCLIDMAGNKKNLGAFFQEANELASYLPSQHITIVIIRNTCLVRLSTHNLVVLFLTFVIKVVNELIIE